MSKRKKSQYSNTSENESSLKEVEETTYAEESSGLLDVSDILEPEMPEVTTDAISWGWWNDSFWPMYIRREADKDHYRCFIFHPKHRLVKLKIPKKKFEPLGIHKSDSMCLKRSSGAKLYEDVLKSLSMASAYSIWKERLPDLSPEMYLDVCSKSLFLEFSIDEFKKRNSPQNEHPRAASTSPEMRPLKYPGTTKHVKYSSTICGPDGRSDGDSEAKSTLEQLKSMYPSSYEKVMRLNEQISAVVRCSDTVSVLIGRIREARENGENFSRGIRCHLFDRRADDISFRRLKGDLSQLGTLSLDNRLSFDLYQYLLDQGPWLKGESFPVIRDFLFYVVLPEAVIYALETIHHIGYEEADKMRVQGLFALMPSDEVEKWNGRMDQELESDIAENNRLKRLLLVEKSKHVNDSFED